MSLLAQNSDDMQCLLDAVQEFEVWSGIPVNTTKTKLMVVDGMVANRTRDVPGTGNIQGHSIRYYPRDRIGALSGFLGHVEW